MVEEIKDSPQLAISWMLLASLAFASGSALVKWTAGSVDVWTVVFGRSLVIVIVILFWSYLSGASLKVGNRSRLLWRCTVGLSAMLCYFYSVQEISLSNAVTLQYSSPIFVALFSGIMLSEKVSPLIYGCIFFSFVGVILIVSPSLKTIETGASIALLSGILSAFAYLAVRGLKDSSSPDGIVFWFAVFCTILTLPFAITKLSKLEFVDILAVIGVGVCAGIGQTGMTRAYHAARAAYVGAFSYATVIVGVIYSWLLFDQEIVTGDFLGTLFIVISGAILTINTPKTSKIQDP